MQLKCRVTFETSWSLRKNLLKQNNDSLCLNLFFPEKSCQKISKYKKKGVGMLREIVSFRYKMLL